jgi:hypothetical protein
MRALVRVFTEPPCATGGLERIRRDDRPSTTTITTTTFGYEWSPAGTEPGRGPELTLMGPYSFVQGPEDTRGKGRACANMSRSAA